MNSVGLRVCVSLLPIPLFLLYALVICGCISDSPGIPNLFLLKVEEISSTPLPNKSWGLDTQNEVRIGYFGACVRHSSRLKCGPSSSVFEHHLPETSIQPIISYAHTLQTKIFLCVLAASGSMFLLGFGAGCWLKYRMAHPTTNTRSNKRISRIKHIFACLALGAAALALGAAIGTTQAASALEYSTSFQHSPFQVVTGMPLQILQWFIAAFSLLFAWGGISICNGNLQGSTGSSTGPKSNLVMENNGSDSLW